MGLGTGFSGRGSIGWAWRLGIGFGISSSRVGICSTVGLVRWVGLGLCSEGQSLLDRYSSTQSRY
jgi:hypothetical protein